MNFKSLGNYFSQLIKPTRTNMPARGGYGQPVKSAPRMPIYRKPPTIAQGLRFTEALTPKNEGGLSRAISNPVRRRKDIRRKPVMPIFRPETDYKRESF